MPCQCGALVPMMGNKWNKNKAWKGRTSPAILFNEMQKAFQTAGIVEYEKCIF